jgi:tRNA threonylcarbamoyl adenosine modification protein YeaZ
VPTVLIIETSTDTASLALVIDDQIVVEKSFTSDRRHNALLFEPLAEILDEFGTRAFDAVLVGSGPGSYSGTRVGIATAQGAAIVSGCKTIAIPSILATEPALSGKPCLALGDARRGSFWIARISEGQLIDGPSLSDSAGFDSALQSSNSHFSMEHIRNYNISLARPSASRLWQVWQNASPQTRALWAAKPPQPIYLAPPHITPSKKQVFS